MTNTPTPTSTRTALTFTGTCTVCHDVKMTFVDTDHLIVPPEMLVVGHAGLVPEFECGGCGSRGPAVTLADDRDDFDTVEVDA